MSAKSADLAGFGVFWGPSPQTPAGGHRPPGTPGLSRSHLVDRQGARWLPATMLVAGMGLVPWRLFANFGDSLWTVSASVLYVLAALAGIWQMWRICVTLTPEKVIVRNPWRDHHITWDRIADIERESVLGRQRISLVLTDGSSVPCAIYSGMSLSNAPLGEDFVAAVQARIGSVDR